MSVRIIPYQLHLQTNISPQIICFTVVLKVLNVSTTQECEDRDKSITEFNLREKQLKQEIQSLYDQIDDCQARERTYTNESFRSRLGELKLLVSPLFCIIK